MAFKTYKTYGKRRNRVVKMEVWLTPEKKLFSSCSSENTASETELSQISGHNDKSSSRLRAAPSISEDCNHGVTDHSDYSKNVSYHKAKTSFLGHSTPLSSTTSRITNRLEFKKISPFTNSDPYQADCSDIAITNECKPSPSLFSDMSNVSGLNSITSLNEDNCKLPSRCYAFETEKSHEDHNSKSSSTSSEKDTKNCDENISSDLQSMSDKVKELKLFDVKVYLDAHEALCLLQLNKPTKQNKVLEKESDSLLDSTSQLKASGDQNEVVKLDVINIQEIGESPVVFQCTPLLNQHLKNVTGKNLSFVEALTPLRFQRRKTLSAKEKILLQCDQETPLKFKEVLTDKILRKCVKVGEGTYGEVFKTNDGREDVAIKIIPIEGNFPVNEVEQKTFNEILPEIVISKELGNLGNVENGESSLHTCPNFIKVKRVMLIQDSYPEKLLNEWDEWKKTHPCENERPDIFQANQYFIVFEFVNGGEDLETFQFSDMAEALSVLQQIVLALSVAEQSLEFEHRDLHWGNVLIKRTKCQTIQYKLHGQDIHLKNNGVFVSIIDFTLSRLTKDGVTVFCDLSNDPDMFTGKGDYQFEVYRLMRKNNEDDWQVHTPYSNVLWIRYLIDKIVNVKKFPPKDKSLQRNIRTFLRRVLTYNSALEAASDEVLALNIPSFS